MIPSAPISGFILLRRSLRSPVLYLTLLSLGLYLAAVAPYPSRGQIWDSAIYISLARAMIDGQGYTFMGYAHTKYPPGFPILLAGVELVCGHSFLGMRLLIAGLAAAAVAMIGLLMRRLAPASVALAVTVAAAVSYAMVSETTRILSDIPYMFLSLGALWAGERLVQKLVWRRVALTIAFIFAAYLVRIIGFTLAPAIALALLLGTAAAGQPLRRRLGMAAAILAATALVIGLWMGRNLSVAHALPSTYFESMTYEQELALTKPWEPGSAKADRTALWRRLDRNFDYYKIMLTELLTAKKVVHPLAVNACALLFLAGWIFRLVRRRSALEFYTLFYLLIMLLWPSQQGTRFLLPVLPMIFFYPLHVMAELLEWLCRRGDAPASSRGQIAARFRVPLMSFVALMALALNGPLVIPMIRAEHARPYYDPAVGEYLEALDWLRRNTPPDAVIISEFAPMAYLHTGRLSFVFDPTPRAEDLLTSITLKRGTHLILSGFWNSKVFLQPVLGKYPHRFREIHRFGQTRIFQIVH